jgi:DNA-binding transcriptional LysR family regulator
MQRGDLIDLIDLALFRSVVETGGVSAAAHALRSSPPAISRRLADLEARLGVKLAERSSRRFRITEEGSLLYSRACVILEQLRDTEAEVSSRGTAARGLLRVGAPNEFGRRYLAPLVARFIESHPGLRISLTLSDAGLEVGEDGFDVVLRIGLPAEQGLLAHKLSTSPCVVVASAAYVARCGLPASLDTLADHPCLILERRKRLDDVWTFLVNGKEREITVRGVLASGSGEALHAWAKAGAGLSMEALWDVLDDLASGELVRVLPAAVPKSIDLFATFAPGRPIPPRVRLFVDFLAAAMQDIVSTSLKKQCGSQD